MNHSKNHQTTFDQFATTDEPYQIVAPGRARVVAGAAAEELACAYLRIHPSPIDGRQNYNPDAVRGDSYYEIKSVRDNSKVVIYQWRINKDLTIAKGNPLHYVLVIHKIKPPIRTIANVWDAYADHGITIAVLPLDRVVKAYEASGPDRAIKTHITHSGTRNGYQRKGYRDGYRNVTLKLLIGKTLASQTEVFNYRNREIPITLIK